MKLKNTIKCGLTALILSLCSCDSWLDVTPTDRLSEDMLFEDRKGFVKALNGVYVELATNQLYGKDLTAGALDAMGQYYTCANSSSHAFYYYISLLYTGNEQKALFQNMWDKCYLVLACCNSILEKCEEKGVNMSDPYLSMIKGEALALRAMLHLDMLRLFGPIPSELGNDAIPYQIGSKLEVTPILTGKEVLARVIEDLKVAVILLKESDPYLVTDKSLYDEVDVKNRQFRLNYFAAKALLARAYLWGNDKTNAYKTATEVISEAQEPGKELFPFVTNAAATNASSPDRMFSTEVFFAVYHSSREDVFDELFSPMLDVRKMLTASGTLTSGRVDGWYDDKNDYRYKVWAVYNKDGESVLYHNKFALVENTSAPQNYMMPLIRLSEMYLIAAECGDTPATYLNQLRQARNCISLPESGDYSNNIALEYTKEMLGEGQMFFYFKRNEMQNIPDGQQVTGNKNVDMASYVIPLPDSEISERIDYNK